MSERTEVHWGRQADCEAQGCDPPHADAATIYRWHFEGSKTVPHPERVGECPPINGHAMRWVRRTVTFTAWGPADVG